MGVDDLELILRRAAELDRSRPAGEEQSLDLQDVERIGIEAGFSREAILRATSELKAGKLARAEPASLLDKLVGPAGASSERLLDAPPDEVRERLHGLLRRELLQIEERHGERVKWGVESSLRAHVQRAINWAGQSAWKRAEIESEVREVGNAQTRVRLSAAAPGERLGPLLGLSLGAGGPVLGVAGLIWFADPSAAAHAVAAGMGFLGAFLGVGAVPITRAILGKRVKQLRAAIERVLERLEHGDS